LDDFDNDEGYEIAEEKTSYWQEQKQILHFLYRHAINHSRCSFVDCCNLDLAQFIDYVIFDLDGREENVSIPIEAEEVK
jgi:hypothetical protein